MILIIASFFAGVLTVLAPCVILFLPVILSRSVDPKRKPWLVILSLALSVFVFSIILKSSTLLIDIPQYFWNYLSGFIVFVFGCVTLWPKLWEAIAMRLDLTTKAQKQLSSAGHNRGIVGDVLVGASLGPVFSACSPTYALIVATILPVKPIEGVVYLLSYIAGLVLILTLIAIFGRKVIQRLRWGINPNSVFHKIFGITLIVVGLMIIFGIDKLLLSTFIENGLFDWQLNIESLLYS